MTWIEQDPMVMMMMTSLLHHLRRLNRLTVLKIWVGIKCEHHFQCIYMHASDNKSRFLYKFNVDYGQRMDIPSSDEDDYITADEFPSNTQNDETDTASEQGDYDSTIII